MIIIERTKIVGHEITIDLENYSK